LQNWKEIVKKIIWKNFIKTKQMIKLKKIKIYNKVELSIDANDNDKVKLIYEDNQSNLYLNDKLITDLDLKLYIFQYLDKNMDLGEYDYICDVEDLNDLEYFLKYKDLMKEDIDVMINVSDRLLKKFIKSEHYEYCQRLKEIQIEVKKLESELL